MIDETVVQDLMISGIVVIMSVVLILSLSSFGIAFVNGTSMVPTYTDGEIVVYNSSVSVSDINTGDVIVFYDDRTGNNVIHRVVEKTDNHIVTKGDNNDKIDSTHTTNSNLIGVVAYDSITSFGSILISSLFIHILLFLGSFKILRCIRANNNPFNSINIAKY